MIAELTDATELEISESQALLQVLDGRWGAFRLDRNGWQALAARGLSRTSVRRSLELLGEQVLVSAREGVVELSIHREVSDAC